MDQNNQDRNTASPENIEPQVVKENTISKKSSRIALLLTVLAMCLVAAGAIYLININDSEVIEPTLVKNQKSNIIEQQIGEIEGLKFTNITEKGLPSVEMYAPTIDRLIALEATGDYTLAAEYEFFGEKMYTPEEITNIFVEKAIDDGYELQTVENKLLADGVTHKKENRVQKENIRCSIYAYENGFNQGIIYRLCVNTDLIDTEAARLKKFYDAYEASSDYIESDYRGPYYLSVDENDAQDSSIEGYQYLYGGIGYFGNGANVAFVREESGEWSFFTGRQSILNCDEYDTELFRKALADETCQAEQYVQKTVKEYYNL